jgi:predicted nucleotidyltransferase
LALFSQNQMEILALLYAHPGEEFYLSQIGQSINKKPGVFQRGINALVKNGILKSRPRGNQRLFTVNNEYPFLNEIRSIVTKSTGIEGLLRDFVNNQKPIKTAVIFGSFAKNHLGPHSDIDLLLVTKDKKIEDSLILGLHVIENKIQREINYKIYLSREFNDKIAAHDEFLQEILNDKYILLKGTVE